MRRTPHVPAILTVLLLLLAIPATSQASPLWGKYLQTCLFSEHQQVDPLVSPGGVADHDHWSVGTKGFSATMTTAEALDAPTTCLMSTNHSAYWTPTYRMPDGESVPGMHMGTYYAAGGAESSQIAGGKITPFPVGFRALYKKGVNATVRWRCGSGTQTYVSQPSRATCGTYTSFSVEYDTNHNCWDGLRLDSPDHMSHIAPASTGACPASHKFRLPQLQAQFSYPVRALDGGLLDSDHGIGPAGRTAHFDLWEAQDSLGQAVTTSCMSDPARNFPTAPLCGLFTYTTGNNWLANLNAWAGKLDYVAAANGTAATRTAP